MEPSRKLNPHLYKGNLLSERQRHEGPTLNRSVLRKMVFFFVGNAIIFGAVTKGSFKQDFWFL